MTYTLIAVITCGAVVGVDLFALRTRMVARAEFWTAYAIMLGFQFATNAVLTGRQVVNYADDTILGTGNDVAAPVMFGAGRLLYAPVEDLLFGFALILLAAAVWEWLGRCGLDPGPISGPPRWRRAARRRHLRPAAE